MGGHWHGTVTIFPHVYFKKQIMACPASGSLLLGWSHQSFSDVRLVAKRFQIKVEYFVLLEICLQITQYCLFQLYMKYLTI